MATVGLARESVGKSYIHVTERVVPTLVISVITVLGATLRFCFLGRKPLWLDEAVLWLIQREGSATSLVSANAHRNSAPPLFALLLHFTQALGSSESSLRFLPALASTATIPALYVLSIKLYKSRRAGYLAALLISLSPTQLVYAQQVREYSMSVLFTCLTLLLATISIQRPSWLALGLLTFLEAVDILTQWGLVFIVVTTVIITGWNCKFYFRTKMWLFSHFLIFPVIVWIWISTARYQIRSGKIAAAVYLQDGYPDGHAMITLLHFIGSNSAGLIEYSFGIGNTAFLLLSMACVLGAMTIWTQPRGSLWLVGLCTPIMLIFCAACLHYYPYLPARQDIVLTVPIILLASWGLSRIAVAFEHLPQISFRYVAYLALLVSLLILIIAPMIAGDRAYLANPGLEDNATVVGTLRADRQPSDHIFVQYDAIPGFLYYWCRSAHCDPGLEYRGHLFVNRQSYAAQNDGPIVLGLSPDRGSHAPRLAPSQINAVLTSSPRTWLVFSHTSDADRSAVLALAHQHGLVREIRAADGASLYLLTRSS